MNEINISEERLNNSTLLSSPGLDIELWRLGHITFAVCDRNDGMRYAFASAELANYLGRAGTIKITDVKLFKQTAVVGDDQLALKVSGTSEHDRICVEGEFMTFSVKEFAHGLLIFDHA